MTYLLRAFGYTVLVAENGHQGLETAAREHPGVIIRDLQLPDIDGFEVARRLETDARLRTIPRGELSGFGGKKRAPSPKTHALWKRSFRTRSHHASSTWFSLEHLE